MTAIGDSLGVSRQSVQKRSKREGWARSTIAAEELDQQRREQTADARAAADTAWWNLRTREADRTGALVAVVRRQIQRTLVGPDGQLRTTIDSLDLQRLTLSHQRLIGSSDLLSGAGAAGEEDLSAVRQFIVAMAHPDDEEPVAVDDG